LVKKISDNIGMQNSASTDSEKRSWFKDVWNSVGNTDGIFTLYIEADDLQRVKNRLVQVKSAEKSQLK